MTTHEGLPGLERPTGADPGRLLRLALQVDAVVTGAFGVLLLGAGPLLAGLLGTPPALLLVLGPLLIAYAAGIWITGTRRHVNRSAAWSAVGLNALWVVGSVLAVTAGWFSLTVLGTAFILAQAVMVALFADLQFLGLRRARPATA
ncbi:MAG TPA: hypothetical protein VHS99_08635 [Chloroflexota bacterium]|nr:hypothetical protein [Chloroflexota bacterium]